MRDMSPENRHSIYRLVEHIEEAAPGLDAARLAHRIMNADCGALILPGASCSFEMPEPGVLEVMHVNGTAEQVAMMHEVALRLGVTQYNWAGRRGWRRAIRMMEG